MDLDQMDPLCPLVPVIAEEKKKLCRPGGKSLSLNYWGGKLGTNFFMEGYLNYGIYLAALNLLIFKTNSF